MKKYLQTAIACCLLFVIINSCSNSNSNSPKEKEGQRERIERDLKMMKDPATGMVPSERLLKAKEYKDELIQSQTNAAISGISWSQLGPKNQGGRSRAVLVDANDATGNTVWVGSVGGGLWKTTNISAATPSWAPVNDFFDNLAITSIAQDPSNPSIMYFCTGEGYFNGDAIRGMGVWKSTNAGATWSQLASTNIANFYNCQRVVVNSTGIVFVATRANGLQRSSDGGASWTKVLGLGLGITGAGSNFCYDVDIAANGDVYSTLSGSIHKSTNAGVTFAAAQTLPISADRIELACAPNDAAYVYAVVELGNVVSGIIQSTNSGGTWTSRAEPADADPGIPAADFSRGQAWYDLTIAVDPNNRDVVFVGGVDLFKSFDGGGTWSQISHWYGGFSEPYVHADQHYILFRPGSSTTAYFVNDGGIYQTTDANALQPTMVDKGTNYVTAQFYACAIHPTAFTNYFLGGTQDNGSHQFTQGVLQNTTEVTGGDGAFCHIDQDEPQFQFTSYVNNEFFRSTNGGASWSGGIATSGGSFISPTDYDDVNDKLYMCNTSGTYQRWDDPQTGSTFVTVSAGFGDQVSAIKVSPNTSNRVFFGTEATGDVFRVDNAHTGTPTVTNISTGLPNSYVSCIEVQTGNDNHLLAVFSNYGVNSVWESTNGGSSWTSVEGNLPDMPIRWALFNPNNSDQAVIATELGVWSTDNLNGGATNWGTSNSGLANVRVDMLQIRSSDKVMIAATHGRGMFMSSAFAAPTALFEADKIVTYRGVPINFTSTSYNATSWSWNFGDATSSTAENPSKFYSAAGRYNVTLTINSGASSVTKTQYIHVLPNRGTPYTPAAGGNFDVNTDDFDGVALTGATNKWERGVPTNFLTTVNSAPNVWKTDLDADLTQGTYSCALMTPNYNFTAAGAYSLRFRRSMEIVFCNAPFAVQVQYTTDKGLTWTRLGVNADPLATNWYNRGPATGCLIDASIFSDRYGWTVTSNNTLCTYDVSFLAGNPNVAFRFVLSVSGNFGSGYNADGFMVDDFEIQGPLNVALAVTLTNFTATKQGNDVAVNWRTQNEVDIDKYAVERSFDGQNFTSIAAIGAKNQSSNSYAFVDKDVTLNSLAGSTIYYRLKINDKIGRIKYSEIARINLAKTNTDVIISPNPVREFINLTTNETIALIEIIDATGKIVLRSANLVANRLYLDKKMASGIYIVKITFASGKTVVKQIVKS